MNAKRMSKKLGAGLLAVIAMMPVTAEAAEFFAGKTITIIAGFRPGGGVDSNARLHAAHLGKFIPGNPKTVVKNISGAAGVVAANHLYNKARPDGLTIAVPGRGWMLQELIGNPGIKFESLKFSYIGSPGNVNSILWLRSELGIMNLDQLKKASKKVVLAGYSKGGQQVVVPKILGLNGWPFRPLAGYRGTSKTLLALERKEIDGIFLPRGSFMSNRRDLLDNKVVVPLMQTHDLESGMAVTRDLARPQDRPVLALVNAQGTFGAPLIGPPGIPAERLETLQSAFLAMTKSPGYVAEAKKRGIPYGQALGGRALHQLVAKTMAAPAHLVKRYRELSPPRKRRAKKKK